MSEKTDPPQEQPHKGLLASFPGTFWMANAFELFERGAYYGMNSLLGRYLTDKVGGALGFSEDRAGLLQGVVYAVTYILPILGGALADRYGYRKMLLFAFSLLSAGYFVTGQVDGYWVVFGALLIMATGSGLFKPIISGTIARTTDERTSSFGFGLYYWMINLGALVAPLLAGWFRDDFGWSTVFTASSLYCAAMLLPTVFVYRDPPRPESTKSLREVLGGAVIVLSDARFMLMILVYSCFWILYFQNFGTVLWYLRDFIDPTPLNDAINGTVNGMLAALGSDRQLNFQLDAEHVTAINAGTIVLLQIVVSRIVKNLRPLPTMIGGIVIGSLGFLCLAISREAWVFVLGIAVFSIGEMTAHPKYIGYIGLIAPPDRKAVYMGYAFLYGVVGSLIGSTVGGEAYHAVLTPAFEQAQAGADPTGTLRLFWTVFAVLGGCTAVLLWVYDRLFGKDTKATRRRARRVMFVVYGFLVVAAIALVAFVWLKTGQLKIKTGIQAGIMILLGGGGLITLRKGGGDAEVARG